MVIRGSLFTILLQKYNTIIIIIIIIIIILFAPKENHIKQVKITAKMSRSRSAGQQGQQYTHLQMP